MIKICDMITGGGKSSAAITYMNEHPDEHFMYVTPYIPETKRIQEGCPGLNFKLPDNAHETFNFYKRDHLKHLLRQGENVAITHVLYGLCDDETIELIRDNGYITIIDEAISVMDELKIPTDDVKVAMGSQFFEYKDDGETFKIVESIENEYNGKWMSDMKVYARSHRLALVHNESGKDCLYVWRFNKDILDASKQVIILTYLFRASTTYYLFQMENIPYQTIGVVKDEDGTYRFSETDAWVPGYTKELRGKIHILENSVMNDIGKKERALSITWQKEGHRHKENDRAYTIKKHLNNFFNNIHRGSKPEDKLWTAHNQARGKDEDDHYKLGGFAADVKGKGYTSRFLVFNQKATNEFSGAHLLAYCMNVYMPLWMKEYYENHGIATYDDEWAVSTLIQWVWRSAIRNGEEIWLYLPSSRMRRLFYDWMDMVEGGMVTGEPVGVIVDPRERESARKEDIA